MSYPANQQQGQRWLPVFNTTDEPVPAYGCMMLAGYRKDTGKDRTDPWRAIVGPDGLAYWRIAKPNRQVCDDQTAAVILFNGPQSIPPQGYGFGTQDYPCQALYGAGATADPGTALSMAEDEWHLRGGPGPFAAFARDGEVRLTGDTQSGSDAYPVWVTKDERRYGLGFFNGGIRYGINQVNNAIQPQGALELSPFVSSNNYAIQQLDNTTVKIREGYGGIAMISFSATIWADATIPRGTILSLGVLATNGGSSGGLTASRAHMVEYDTYPNREPFVAKENVACSGAARLGSGTIIRVHNMSLVDVRILHFCFNVAMLTRDFRDNMYFTRPMVYDPKQIY